MHNKILSKIPPEVVFVYHNICERKRDGQMQAYEMKEVSMKCVCCTIHQKSSVFFFVVNIYTHTKKPS